MNERSIAGEKAVLRRFLRAAYPGDDERSRQSQAICQHVLCYPPFQQAVCVGGYVPLRREADVMPLLEAVLSRGGQLALPRVESEGVMTLRQVAALSELMPGAFGVMEPRMDAPIINPMQIELLLVPLEGIDESGFRLGKGGGYYDRLLTHTSCPTLGVALSWQWVAQIPTESWDKPLDAAVDARGIHRFSHGG